MSRSPFGWSLPPGVTDRMIDEAAGAFDDDMFDGDDEGECPKNKRGHAFVVQEGFDIIGEGRSYCEWCGADGDA